jgi:cell division protein FtsB
MNFWVVLYRIAWIVVIVALTIGIVCVFLPKCYSYQELKKRRQALEESNVRTEARIRGLERRQERFRTDPEYVERVAREQGMVKPGETVFRFAGTNAQSRSRQP